jgi:hypothetical protein
MRMGALAVLVSLLAMTVAASAEPGFPSGWGGGSARNQDYEFGTTVSPSVADKQAAYIRAKPDAAPNAYFVMFQCIKADDYIDRRVRLTCRLRTIDASAEQMFLRVNGPAPEAGAPSRVLNFYNMSDRPIRGTTNWDDYQVVLDVPPGAIKICYGFLLAGGKGEAWADGFSISTVSESVAVSVTPPRKPVNLSLEK